MKYKKHIFVCINERETTAPRKSCGEATGMAIAQRFKELIQKHKLRVSVRVQRTSCFDFCEHGPIAVIYPEGVFYKNLCVNSVGEVFDSHILNNIPVEELQLKFPKNE